MGYLICGKCKSYYKLQSGDSAKDFVDSCDCGGKLRYVENLDIVDPSWKQVSIPKKSPKSEIIRNKMQSVFSMRNFNLKNRLIKFWYNLKTPFVQFWNNYRYRIRNNQNWNNNYNTNYSNAHYGNTQYGREAGLIGLINSIKNELNFHNIRWTLVVPVALAITMLLTFTQGIFTLLVFILLVAMGYFFRDQIIGTKNAAVTGAIAFFLGSLFTGLFLYLIPFTILGIINGAVCGWIGGYLKTRISS